METAGQVQGELRTILLTDLMASKTNPRKEFGEARLGELAASMRAAGGAIEPLIVRPAHRRSEGKEFLAFDREGFYEIIAGERRFKAAKLAGLTDLACLVREVTDEQAIEMQLIENLQREDLNPLEEGQAYRTLMERTKQTAEEIGAKVGKSRRYVYARMKLCALIPEAAKLVAAGTLSASHGDLLGRLNPKDQKELLRQSVRKCHDGTLDVWPLEQVERTLKEKIYRELDAAPWKKDDAGLLPSAGACTVCPKNSTVNPDLVVGGKPNRCTDRVCYQVKWDAWLKGKLAALKAETGKEPVLLKGANYYAHDSKAVDHWNWKEHAVKKGSCESVEAGIIVGGEGLGETRWLCRNAQCKAHKKRDVVAESRAPQRDYHAEQQLNTRIQARTLEAILAKVMKPGPAEVQVILECLVASATGLDDEIVDAVVRATKSRENFGKVAPEQRLRVAYGMAIAYGNAIDYGRGPSEAKRLKVDVKAIEKQAKAELAAEAKQKAEGKKAEGRSQKESKKVPTPARKGSKQKAEGKKQKTAKKGKKR